jgi:hypothetical protein
VLFLGNNAIKHKRKRKEKDQRRMESLEKPGSLSTRHKAKTNRIKT